MWVPANTATEMFVPSPIVSQTCFARQASGKRFKPLLPLDVAISRFSDQ
jgi:hypothetical protein